MKLLLIVLLLGLSLPMVAQTTTATAPEPREFEMKDGDTTYVMRRYVLVLLTLAKKQTDRKSVV